MLVCKVLDPQRHLHSLRMDIYYGNEYTGNSTIPIAYVLKQSAYVKAHCSKRQRKRTTKPPPQNKDKQAGPSS